MDKVRVQYKCKIEMKWIHDSESTDIPPSSVGYVIIERDYDNSNAPVMYVILNIATTMYNKMIAGQKKDRIFLSVSHYNSLEEKPRDIVDIKDQFMYFLPSNADSNEELAIGEEQQVGIESAFSRVTMGLLLPRILEDNRKTMFSDIYRDINKSTLVYLSLAHVSKLCINNIADKEIDVIAMPTMSGVNDYLKYIDDKYGIYKLGYRYFHDLDITYLLNESGAYIPNGNSEFKKVTINVDSNIADDTVTLGMYILEDSYQIDVASSGTVMTIDKSTSVAVSKVSLINHLKGKRTDAILENGAKTEYIREDRRNADRIEFNAKKYSVTLDVIKSYIDDELFTPNKVYKVKNYDKYREHDGRYILYKKRTVYENRDSEFVPTTMLSLRKKLEL